MAPTPPVPPEQSLLFTDFYQVTMAQLYFDHGLHETTAQFEYWYRRNPDYRTHQAGYGIFAGLDWILDWMERASATSSDIEYLRSVTGASGQRLFREPFLEWLEMNGNFSTMTLEAVAEGRVVHPNVPLVVVEGPLAMAQMLETPLLNQLNHQTLIATKASRVVEAARGQPVFEFGMRRGPGSGATGATRGAFVGGAIGSSNVAASRVFGTPPIGTHAHSMVQAFMAAGQGEIGAFRAYASSYPDDCLLLVDTIDTLESGVPNAITVFEELRADGHEPRGVRIDSGDLAYLAAQASKQLDAAGFIDQTVVLSSSLDELAIFQILSQIESDARRLDIDPDHVIGRLAFGVGSRLISSNGHPYLDGVYKLVALNGSEGWRPAIKMSENPEKVANPGRKDAWRLYDERGIATADVLTVEGEDIAGYDEMLLHHPTQMGVARTMQSDRVSRYERLLDTVMKDGQVVIERPAIAELQARRTADLDRLDGGVRRLINPHLYHVSLTDQLLRLKQQMIAAARDGHG